MRRTRDDATAVTLKVDEGAPEGPLDTAAADTIPSPGEVMALLSPVQELAPGLYVVGGVMDGWALLLGLLDDERHDRLVLTGERSWVPVEMLAFCMRVGIHLTLPD